MRNTKTLIAVSFTLLAGCSSSSGTGDDSSAGRAGERSIDNAVGGLGNPNAGAANLVGGAGGDTPLPVGGSSSGGSLQSVGGSGLGGAGFGGAGLGGAGRGGGPVSESGGQGVGGSGVGGAATGGLGTGGQGLAGVPSEGGALPGGSANGGAPSSGGMGQAGNGEAGQSAAGAGQAGAANQGGSGNVDDPIPSPGCEASSPFESGTFVIDVEGTERTYILKVPDDYDPTHPYPFIFVWHPLGGSADQVVRGNYDGLEPLSDGTAILVAPDGLMGTVGEIEGKGWYNEGGNDLLFLDQMLELFKGGLCLDENRFFSTGFSFGGMMSYTVGCQYSDEFRAIAPASGSMMGGCNQSSARPIAVFGIHGASDTFVATSGGRDARDVFLERNNCGTETVAVDPSPCVEYQGCDEGYPVYWCEFAGEHQPWSEAPEAIWNFFSQF